MLIAILLSGISLFLVYNAILLITPVKKEAIYTNKERAEEFVYSNNLYSTILVGSGLIGNFSAKPFQRQNLFNLYLPYNGSCTGIEIVALSGKIPRALLIETNYIFKGFEKQLVKDLFRPGFYRIRFFLPSLLKKHTFISVAKEVLRPSGPIQMKADKLPELLYLKSLEKYKDAYDQLPDFSQFSKDLKKLEEYLKYIYSKGCTIIFFEMPLENQLINSPLATFQRNMIRTVFSGEEFNWILPGSLDGYETEDGIHLLEKGVFKYFHYLTTECNKILNCRIENLTV